MTPTNVKYEFNNKPPQRVKDAIRVAEHRHDGQVRRYTNQPYVTHPMAVAELVFLFDELGVKPLNNLEDSIIAALLHDIVEDTDMKYSEIQELFGFNVTYMVRCLTDQVERIQGNRRLRKRLNAQLIANSPVDVQVIKVLDMFHNSLNIYEYDKKFFSTFADEFLLMLQLMGNPHWSKRFRSELIDYKNTGQYNGLGIAHNLYTNYRRYKNGA